jgi:transposase
LIRCIQALDGAAVLRGSDTVAGALFSDVDLEKRVRPDHPLRVIRGVVNATLAAMSVEFDALYAPGGRVSIPPERLLRALLLQAFYTIRSERQLVERIEFDLLFRWFVGLGVDDPVWDATTFTKNRDRLLAGEIASRFLATVLAQPKVKTLLSSEHFSVDGTLLEAWASTKSFRPKDGSGPPPGAGRNGEQDFHGQKRSNDTHASTTDGDARLYKKGQGKEAKLCFMEHALMENRNGLIIGATATRASGHAERLAAQHLIEPHAERAQRITVAGDKGYDTQDFVAEMREINVTPHVAQNDNGRRSAIDGRTTRHPGYVVSLRIRKRIEEAFGWAKTVVGLRKARHRGLPKIDWQFTFAMAAYNLVRLPRLLAAAA